jgi:Domain of unknown function (DUF4188)
MRVRSLTGARTLRRIGREIRMSVQAKPDGLLRHEMLAYSLLPPHVGMRQYWRDLDSLERWTRAGYHRQWWADLIRDPAGTGFWHEAYLISGGMEAIFVNMPGPLGAATFAPQVSARGAMLSTRQRLGRAGTPPPAVVSEPELEPTG